MSIGNLQAIYSINKNRRDRYWLKTSIIEKIQATVAVKGKTIDRYLSILGLTEFEFFDLGAKFRFYLLVPL